jgi:light-regulated signal transduction histidine kinase (bacteriophytochrome)
VAGHDLQEPLHKIIAFGDLLSSHSSSMIDDKGRDYLGRMLGAAGRMRRLIEDLLKFSRISTREETFETLDLGVVVREVIQDLELRISETGAQFEIGPLPVIEGSHIQMREVFQNLIGNALKFRKTNEAPNIQIKGRDFGTHSVEIEVSDNGIGFDEKFLERIFRPFERLHRRTEYDGSGIGLAICQKVISRHGGRIFARSAPGKGSTFVITLPKRSLLAPADSAEPRNKRVYISIRDDITVGKS